MPLRSIGSNFASSTTPTTTSQQPPMELHEWAEQMTNHLVFGDSMGGVVGRSPLTPQQQSVVQGKLKKRLLQQKSK